jgi:hypothetical protein
MPIAADTTHAEGRVQSPSREEISPAEWWRRQLAAADKSDEILRTAQKLPGLLAQYEYLQTAYDANSDRAFRLIFGQYLSWFQTFIGDYDGAATSFSIAQPAQADDAPSPLTNGYVMKPADELIVELARTRKAVFFNEAHSAPITRTLTIALLPKLRELGFDYFAAETLYDTDRELMRRGYPTAKSGFYVDEPLYGEMIRTALKLGYTVLAYDVEQAGTGDARERAGAERLYREVFRRDPHARLVVNAGFAHVQKSGPYLGGRSMGEFFAEISGIDPLTVEQTMLIAHPQPDQDHPYYRQIVEALRPRRPLAFVDARGTGWTLKPGKYDLSVLFPPTETVKQRPDWLTLGGLRRPYPVGSELCRNQFPCLVEARYADEGDDAVAADRVVLNVVDPNAPAQQRILEGHGEAQSRLFLRPGQYRLRTTDRSNRTLLKRDLTIPNDPRNPDE